MLSTIFSCQVKVIPSGMPNPVPSLIFDGGGFGGGFGWENVIDEVVDEVVDEIIDEVILKSVTETVDEASPGRPNAGADTTSVPAVGLRVSSEEDVEEAAGKDAVNEYFAKDHKNTSRTIGGSRAENGNAAYTEAANKEIKAKTCLVGSNEPSSSSWKNS